MIINLNNLFIVYVVISVASAIFYVFFVRSRKQKKYHD